ncbi:MAG: phosphoribosylformylglycinamidine cyclo-ligase [Gemmatimonadaceae bacterium]
MTHGAGAGSPLHYRSAGVDIDVADDAKTRIRKLVESTRTAGALGEFGGFGGLFRAPAGLRPILVASADGVGTKLKVAIAAKRHDSIGHDLVNHCVNDILVQGAAPLFFLDYVAFGVLDAGVAEAVVGGVAAGCRENACALIGGETAEMPGVYAPNEYDLAGFIVGVVEESALLGSARVVAGDALVALASSGLHTNGYSLARHIIFERMGLAVTDEFPEHAGASVADVLLRVHRAYGSALGPVLGELHALAHITGGGIPGNLNRGLPGAVDAVIRERSWDVPPLFRVLQDAGRVPRDEMFRAFNMGVGMIVVCPDAAVPRVIASAHAAQVEAWRIGHTTPGAGRVLFDHG